jgi:hypothetical protein
MYVSMYAPELGYVSFTTRVGFTPYLSAWSSSTTGGLDGVVRTGFVLICFQYFSIRNVATLLAFGCPTNSRSTIGCSIQILAYYEQASSPFHSREKIETNLPHDGLNPIHVTL